MKKGELSSKRDTNNKVLAIIYSDKNRFLLLRTNPKTMKIDSWYVVTGGVKETESFEGAVRREVEEETKLQILDIKPLELSWDYEWPKGSGKVKHEKGFLVKVKHAEPKITAYEHLEYKWLGKEDFIDQIYWYDQNKDNLKKILTKLPKLK
jgi:8-oxo-dGTP pyrophosphatase MutT (NUDIX family)